MSSHSGDLEDAHDANLGFIISLCWEKDKIAAAYYNLTTFELVIAHESLDCSPEFGATLNLLRQLQPCRHVIASGSNEFLEKILQTIDCRTASNLEFYRVRNLRMVSIAQFMIYQQGEKTLLANRNRIIATRFPGTPDNLSSDERVAFVGSILPLEQPLVVHSLGALLEYLLVNRQHLLLASATEIVINDLRVYSLLSEVPVDEITLNSIGVFSASLSHASTYKKGNPQANHPNRSIFTLMNRCLSPAGTKMMRMFLAHPIRETNELAKRLATIEWFQQNPQSSERLTEVEWHLKQLGGTNRVFRNIVLNPELLRHWDVLKRIVYHAYKVSKCCKDLVANGQQEVSNSLFAELAEFHQTEKPLLNLLAVLDRVVDLESGISKFTVKMGLDTVLDEKKEFMISILDRLQESFQIDLQNVSNAFATISVLHVPEVGYVARIDNDNNQPSAVQQQLSDNFEFISRSKDAYYFRNRLCNELNEQYGNLYTDICELESRIRQRLVEVVKNYFPLIQGIIQLCAQLDCVLSFAKVAIQRRFVKPDILSEKRLELHKSRHPLYEIGRQLIANDMNASEGLITILSAPNASGKSVYLKQVTLAAFLAHVGSFVPASQARVGLLDSIYSRLNCPESLYGNNSSYLKDLQQLVRVMASSTDRSLILIDEFGKGTNHLEAQALLAACIENLLGRGDKCPITLISTHYADVCDIVQNQKMIAMKTFRMAAGNGGSIRSTFQLIGGRSSREYATRIEAIKEFIESLDERSPELEVRMELILRQVWRMIKMRLSCIEIDFKRMVQEVFEELVSD